MFTLKSDLYLQMTLLRHKADKGDLTPDFPKANVYKRPGKIKFLQDFPFITWNFVLDKCFSLCSYVGLFFKLECFQMDKLF